MQEFYSEKAREFYNNHFKNFKNESGEFKKGYFEACNSCFELEDTSTFTEMKEDVSDQYKQGWELALEDYEASFII